MSGQQQREAVRADILRAFGPGVAAEVLADRDGYGAAVRERNAREAAYIADRASLAKAYAKALSDGAIALPGGLELPEGVRFEWG